MNVKVLKDAFHVLRGIIKIFWVIPEVRKNNMSDGKHFDGKHFDGKHFDGKHFDGKHFDGKHVA